MLILNLGLIIGLLELKKVLSLVTLKGYNTIELHLDPFSRITSNYKVLLLFLEICSPRVMQAF